MTPPAPRRRRPALALSGALLTLLLAPAVAPAAELPLDLGAFDATSFTFRGLTTAVGADSSTGEAAGSALAGDCDFNGDARPDLVVGAPAATTGTGITARRNHGRAYLVFGDTTRAAGTYGLPETSVDPPSAGAVAIASTTRSQQLGSSVACADVDGDGFDDAVIGGETGGLAYVVHGAADLASHAPFAVAALGGDGFTITGPGANRSAVAAIGDLDGDGKEEFAITSPEAEVGGVSSGAVAIVAGRDGSGAITLPGDALLTVVGAAGDGVGSVATVGDVGGGAGGAKDGIPDLLVGAPGVDSPTGTDAGAAYVISGAARDTVDLSAAPADAAILMTVTGPQAAAAAGATVAAAGDANDDGTPDLAIGLGANARVAAPGGGERRSAWVVYGRGDGHTTALGALGSDGYAIDGAPLLAGSDRLGAAFAPLGDVDGDGRGDLAVGAPGYDPLDGEGTGQANTGAVYVIYGRGAAEGGVSLPRLVCEDGARLVGATRITGLGAAVAAGGPFGSAVEHLLVGAANGAESNGNFVRAIPLVDTPGACRRATEEPRPPAYEEVDWGFRENFRRYVTNGFNPAAPAVPIAAGGGATCDANPDAVRGGCDPKLKATSTDPLPARALRWALAGASATDGGDATIAALGTVTFRYPGHYFTLRISDPWFAIAGDQVTVRARVDLDVDPSFSGASSVDVRLPLATFRLDGAPTVTATHVVWRTEAGELNPDAANALGSFLAAGSLLDPVTITIPRSLGELPEEPGVPQEREPDRRDPDTGAPDTRTPDTRVPDVRAPEARPVAVAAVTARAARATVRRAGRVTLATVRCKVAVCRLGAPRRVTLTSGRGRRARRVAVAVAAPARLARGRAGTVRLVLGRAAIRALAGRAAVARVRLVVRGDGTTVTRTLTVRLAVTRAAAGRAGKRGAGGKAGGRGGRAGGKAGGPAGRRGRRAAGAAELAGWRVARVGGRVRPPRGEAGARAWGRGRPRTPGVPPRPPPTRPPQPPPPARARARWRGAGRSGRRP